MRTDSKSLQLCLLGKGLRGWWGRGGIGQLHPCTTFSKLRKRTRVHFFPGFQWQATSNQMYVSTVYVGNGGAETVTIQIPYNICSVHFTIFDPQRDPGYAYASMIDAVLPLYTFGLLLFPMLLICKEWVIGDGYYFYSTVQKNRSF